MKKYFVLIIALSLSCSIFPINPSIAINKDSIVSQTKYKIGAEYNIFIGALYNHYVGSNIIFKNMHQVSLGFVFFEEIDSDVLKNLGFYVNYDFYPNKMTNRVDIFFTTHLLNLNETWANWYCNQPGFETIQKSNYFYHFIGFGFNVRIIKNLNFRSSINTATFGFGKYTSTIKNLSNGSKSSTSYSNIEFVEPEDLLDDLCLKAGFSYYFGRRK
jgi:hypothetical protein